MKIYLARHGQTNYNVLKLCNGDPAVDVYLTQVGFDQASALAEKLRATTIDRVFVSEFKRTKQTADVINTFHNAPITVDPRLNDNRSGYEGKPDRDYYAAFEKAANKWTARFNDGESVEDVKARVKSFITDLKTRDYGSILIVTSMVIIQLFCGILEELTNEQAWELEVDKGSCTELELD